MLTYYAPFDHVNEQARIAIIGITPGLTQARNALVAFQKARSDGADVTAALRSAKVAASFSGPMRSNLIALLNEIKLGPVLGIDSCESLFAQHSSLAHFTSVLRYPVTVRGENYSGSPGILTNEFLQREFEEWFVPEITKLPRAVLVPLGPAVTLALESLVVRGLIDERRVLAGLPHPSGANAERIAYFCARKARELLSKKVNPAKLDLQKSALLSKVESLRSVAT